MLVARRPLLMALGPAVISSAIGHVIGHTHPQPLSTQASNRGAPHSQPERPTSHMLARPLSSSAGDTPKRPSVSTSQGRAQGPSTKSIVDNEDEDDPEYEPQPPTEATHPMTAMAAMLAAAVGAVALAAIGVFGAVKMAVFSAESLGHTVGNKKDRS